MLAPMLLAAGLLLAVDNYTGLVGLAQSLGLEHGDRVACQRDAETLEREFRSQLAGLPSDKKAELTALFQRISQEVATERRSWLRLEDYCAQRW